MATSSTLLTRVKKYLLTSDLNQLPLDGTKNFITFDDITLKLFLKVADTGDYKLLAKEPIPIDECYAHWERIVEKQNDLSGSREFRNVLDLKKAYNMLLKEYNEIKACLVVLCFTVDQYRIDKLRKKGYPIDDSSTETYVESINRQFKRSDNLITRINMKRKQIDSLGKDQVAVRTPTFESLMAGLVFAKYHVDDDIKLVRYLELKKIIEEQNRKVEDNGRLPGRGNKNK